LIIGGVGGNAAPMSFSPIALNDFYVTPVTNDRKEPCYCKQHSWSYYKSGMNIQDWISAIDQLLAESESGTDTKEQRSRILALDGFRKAIAWQPKLQAFAIPLILAMQIAQWKTKPKDQAQQAAITILLTLQESMEK